MRLFVRCVNRKGEAKKRQKRESGGLGRAIIRACLFENRWPRDRERQLHRDGKNGLKVYVCACACVPVWVGWKVWRRWVEKERQGDSETARTNVSEGEM
jgi:hypothetical protein